MRRSHALLVVGLLPLLSWGTGPVTAAARLFAPASIATRLAVPEPPAKPGVLPPDTTLIIVRHGEKPSETADALSDAGTARAERLARALADSGIGAVYHTRTNRARQTAEPLAAALNIPDEQRHAYAARAGDLSGDLVRQITQAGPGRVALVVGHSDTIPDLLRQLGGWTVTMHGHEDVFVVTQPASGPARLVRAGYPPAPDTDR